MKTLFVFYFAILFSGGVVGCLTVPIQLSAKPADRKWLSNQEVICLNSDASRPWRLKWAISEDIWNDGGLFVTVHERRDEIGSFPEFSAGVFIERGGKFKLVKRLNSSGSFFEQPNFAWTKDRTHLLQITEVSYGTGRFTHEHVFRLNRETTDPSLEQVEFIPPDQSFEEYLAAGEGIWKGANSTFTDDGLFFDFAIWNDGDGNCCPTAGKVSGTYKIEHKADGGLRILMDAFKREAVNEMNRK